MKFLKKWLFWLCIFITTSVILGILLGFYYIGEENNKNKINEIFKKQAEIIHNNIANDLLNLFKNLNDVSHGFGIVNSYFDLTLLEFEYLIKNVNTNTFTFSYAPLILNESRSQYEEYVSSVYNTTIHIVNVLNDATRTQIISEQKDKYMPIGFTNTETRILGIDLLQFFLRKEEANLVLATKEPVFSNFGSVILNGKFTPVIALLYPVLNLTNEIIGCFALGFITGNYFANFNTPIGIHYSVVSNTDILYTKNFETSINEIYNYQLIDVESIEVLNRQFDIIVQADQQFKDSLNDDTNKTLLIIGSILMFSIIILIGIIFAFDEKSQNEIHEKIKETTKKTYNRIVDYFCHEIRIPLNTVRSIIQLNTNTDDNSVKLSGENIMMVNDGLNKIQNFTDEMLSFQKLFEGKINIKYEKIHLINYLTSILQQYINTCSTDVIVRLLASQPIINNPQIKCDINKLSQILWNGLSNAAKFTKNGFIQVHVSSYTFVLNTYLSIQIRNTGIGLKGLDMTKIFIPFSQGVISSHVNSEDLFARHNIETISNIDLELIDKTRIESQHDIYEIIWEEMGHKNFSDINRSNGSGMGLPICNMISTALGGKIYLEDKHDDDFNYTLFHSIIKVHKDLSEKEVFIPIEDEIISIDNSKINILVIDDSESNLKIAQKIFSKFGYNTATLLDGIYIDYDTIHNFDIILLDITMKYSNGIDICSKLINNGYVGIILAATGSISEYDIELYKKIGFNGVYTKPYIIDRTVEFITRMLQTKKWDVLI